MERELKKVGVTIQHKWQQYIAINLMVTGVRNLLIITKYGVNASIQ
ncbi:hypothetical protein [Flavobacterium sp. ZE23DGlu08]|nr:hypothetical protein [Flavobacterium sp. ZE23DGlu08]WKL43874.1 hypothetical protein Q1W72_16220 [Flavobacterium sp. ZE23DGlu08]